MTFVVFPYKGKLIKLDHLDCGRIYYRDYYIDLISKVKKTESIEVFLNSLDRVYSMNESIPRVVHLFYELGFILQNNDSINDDDILAIDLRFKNVKYLNRETQVSPIDLKLIKDVSFKDYEFKIKSGLNEIKEGNCYQFNLTYDFFYQFSKKLSAEHFLSKFISKKEKLANYAMFSYIDYLDKIFMTNSPECLFEIKNNEIFSRPIKGTHKWDESKTLNENFLNLVRDKKCESELFMIADLIRNDLNRIYPPNCQVVAKKLPLKVPHLIHQYSLLKKPLEPNTSQKEILFSLFPGGSVTGAPKKRVMKILKKLESRSRSFYCGSTWLTYKNLNCASINIRSAQIDLKRSELICSAGGGITLRSDPYKEYLEMSYKRDSFLSILTT